MTDLKTSLRLTALALTLGATATTTAFAAEEPQVNWYNWVEYIADDTLPEFTKETGIKATYDVYDSNEVVEAKLLAGNTGFDIVTPTNNFIPRLIKAGVFQEIDRSKIPNYANLDPVIMKALESVDPGNKYGVPYMWGTVGIGYNAAKVKAALGDDAPVDSWDMVLKPENLEKLKSCGVSFLDSPGDIFPLVLHYLGKKPDSTEPSDYSGEATDLLMKLRPHITYFHSSKFISDLANGDICVAVAFSGDILQARDRAEEAKNGQQIVYSIPKEGALLWFDVMHITKDAKHPDNAHRLINYLLEPKVSANITNYVAYANPVPTSKEFVKAEILNDKGIYPDAETHAKLYSIGELPQAVHRAMTRAWTRVRTGR